MKSYAARSFFIAVMVPLALHCAAVSAASVALPSLAPVIKVASPAVVNIATRGTLTERLPGSSQIPDRWRRDTFCARR